MRKLIRKILKIIGSVLAVILLALAGYIIYLYASYHRIEDNLQLQVETTRGTANETTNETNNETAAANPESDYFPDIRLPRHCAEAFRYLHPLRNFLTWTDATVFPECR